MSLARPCGRVLVALALLAWPAAVHAVEIRGQVIHPTRRDAAADLEVRLLGLTEEDEPLQRTTRTDSDGAWVFSDLPAPASYLVAATFDGVAFPGGTVSFRAGDGPVKPPLTFHIYDRGSDASALSVPTLRWIVEREAGVYRVSQSLVVENASMRVVVAETGSPALLRMPLGPGHGEVSAAFGRLPEGVTIANGAAELRGPFLPGSSELRLAYDLSTERSLHTQLAALEPTGISGPWSEGAPRVERLELYLRDFGVEVDAGPLHPARPARSGDEIYLTYFGFELPPGRRLPLRVSPLPPARAVPTWVSALLVSLLAGGTLLLVARPLVGGAAGDTELAPHGVGEPERDALESALADLDFDYETGKLSSEDRDQLRAELRSEAVRSVARRQRAPTAQRPLPGRRCSCGHRPEREDRFCAACGKAL